MQYKKFTVEDIPAVTALYVASFNAPPWNDRWTAATAGKRLEQMLRRNSAYGLLAYDGADLCGLVVGDEEQFYDEVQFQIREFCVDNKRRGQGLGTKIYQELERRLKARGIGSIVLYTLRHPLAAGFYQRQGFIVQEEIAFMSKKL